MSEDALRSYLEAAGAENIKLNGDNFVSTCPFHEVKSGLQFAMHAQSGLYVCYSCGASGNLVTFLTDGLGWSDKKAHDTAKTFDVYRFALGGESLKLVPYDQRRMVEKIREAGGLRPAMVKLYAKQCPTYMLKRGFEKALLREWGIGYDDEVQRVTIPVHDEDGGLIGLSKRATLPHQNPPYLHLGFKKSKNLYGLNMLQPCRRVYLVEGQLDVIAYHQLFGRSEAVGTMGTPVSKEQVKKVASIADQVVLAFDNPFADKTGARIMKVVGEQLLQAMGPRVYAATWYPTGCKDIADFLKLPNNTRHLSRFEQGVVPFDTFRLTL